MAFEDLKDTKPAHEMDDIRPVDVDFYETMTMAPHAIYRDDEAGYGYEDTFMYDDTRRELEEQRAKLISMITLAAAVLIGFGLLLVIGYALTTMNASGQNASVSSGSLEL